MENLVARIITTVLVLIALGAVAVLGYKALQDHKITGQIAMVNELYSGITSTYGQASDYNSLTDTVVINAKLLPASDVSGGSITDAYGGAITVGPDQTYARAFDIDLAQIPQSACVKMATGISSSYVTINGGGDLPTPVDPGTATTQCASGSNTLTFVFG